MMLFSSCTNPFAPKLSDTHPQDIVRVQGRVNLQLKRNSTEEDWKILRWRDESNY